MRKLIILFMCFGLAIVGCITTSPNYNAKTSSREKRSIYSYRKLWRDAEVNFWVVCFP